MKENSDFQINVRSRSIRHKTQKVLAEVQSKNQIEPAMLSNKSMKFLANIRSKSVFESKMPSSNTGTRM
jgi:chromosome segregation and condensation protein ScpB